jgi:hypothetical protein
MGVDDALFYNGWAGIDSAMPRPSGVLRLRCKPLLMAKKITFRPKRFRGDVINETIFIEDKLHKYLASQCRDGSKKSDELRKMTFERKARRFRSVVAKNDVPTLKTI